MMWQSFVLVGVGGFVGAILRMIVGGTLNQKYGRLVPVGTLTVNWLGSLLLGMIVASSLAGEWKLLFGTGVMGALTTFSTLKLESMQLHFKDQKRAWIVYNVLCYGGGLLLAAVGIWIG